MQLIITNQKSLLNSLISEKVNFSIFSDGFSVLSESLSSDYLSIIANITPLIHEKIKNKIPTKIGKNKEL